MKLKHFILFGLLTWAFSAFGQVPDSVQEKGSVPTHLLITKEADGTAAHLGQMLGIVDFGDGDSLVSFVPVYFVNDSTLVIGLDTVALLRDVRASDSADNDTDPTNEFQTISRVGNNLYITNQENPVSLMVNSSQIEDFAINSIHLNEGSVDANAIGFEQVNGYHLAPTGVTAGSYTTSLNYGTTTHIDADGRVTLVETFSVTPPRPYPDTLTLVGNTLGISINGDEYPQTTIDLSPVAGTDDQTIDVFSITSNTLNLSLESDGEATKTVSLTPYLDNTDSQTLSFTSPNLSISGGNSVDISGIQDGTGTDDQTIDVFSITSNTLNLSLESDGEATKTVDLSPYLDNTDAQDLSLSGNTLSLTGDGTSVDLSGYLDNTDAQTLADVLTQGNSAGTTDINLNGRDALNLNPEPYGVGWDGDNSAPTKNDVYDKIELVIGGAADGVATAGNWDDLNNEIDVTVTGGSNFSIDLQAIMDSIHVAPAWADLTGVPAGFADNVDNVDDADPSATNEIQDLSLSGNTLTLTGDGTSVDLSGYLDNTDDQTIDVFSITSNTLNLSLESDGEATKTVSLTPYLDNTDSQTLSFTSPNLSISGGNSVNLSALDTKLTINTTTNYVPYKSGTSAFSDSHLRRDANGMIFEKADHGVKIEDGLIRLNAGADSDTLTIRATQGNFAALNGQTDDANNDAVLNAKGFVDGNKVFSAKSNSGGEVRITQRSVSTVDLEIYNASNFRLHDLETDGNAFHAGYITCDGVPSTNTAPEVAVWESGILKSHSGANYKNLNDHTGDVSTSQIENLAVTNAKLGGLAVTSDKLGTGSVTNAKLATNAVTTLKIADGTIQNSDLGANCVGFDNITLNSVGPTQLISTAVTPGSYTNTNLIVDADGRITFAESGPGPATSFSWNNLTDIPAGFADNVDDTLEINATLNYLPYKSGAGAFSDSPIYTSGGKMGINDSAPYYGMDISGSNSVTGSIRVKSTATSGANARAAFRLGTSETENAGDVASFILRGDLDDLRAEVYDASAGIQKVAFDFDYIAETLTLCNGKLKIDGSNSDVVIYSDLVINETSNVRIISGSGSPESSVTAGVGSTYHRTDGGSGTSFYVKESGTGSTGWVAK